MVHEVKMDAVLVEHTPDPVTVVGKAGGICYDREEKESYGDFVRRIVGRGHESVIEHASFTFRVAGISRALTHQLVRHRIASYSQRSQRYCREDGFGYVIPPRIREDDALKGWFVARMNDLERAYNYAVQIEGIRPEDARFLLPNACETRIVITMNARSLRNFFMLRLDRHAQWEIRAMACLMYDAVVEIAPELFDDLQELRDSNNA